MNNLIEDANNKINYFIELKKKVNTDTILCAYDALYKSIKFLRCNSINEFSYEKYAKIIIKKLKNYKKLHIIPAIVNKKNIKYHLHNLTIEHLELSFNFRFFNDIYGINPLMQLTILIYLLKFMNIKKITLNILLRQYAPSI